MKQSKAVAFMMAAIMAVVLAAPAGAFASGDQVNRPEGSGGFYGGQQAAGELPEWAPRAQQSARP